ncbi:hypothetical protein GC194_12110 [bacterium]|nr:hypothetical protein [bacterium]
MRIKLLFLFFLPSVILPIQGASKLGKVLWVCIDNEKKSVRFIDSTASFKENGLKYSLRIKDSLTIECDVRHQNRLVRSGQFVLSDTIHKSVFRNLSVDHIELTDKILVEQIFKMHGNWVWHGSKDNEFYYYGKELKGNDFLVYIKEIDDLVCIKEPRTILNLDNATYIFEKGKTEMEINVWKLLNNSSNWFYGKFKKLNVDRSIMYKAGDYDHKLNHAVIIDSIFKFPVYDISENWKQMEK